MPQSHYLINTTFRCQLACPYCLLPHIKINRSASEHSWTEWALALIESTPQGSVLDFAGGDPLLFNGLAQMLYELAYSGRYWAITTNAIDTNGVNKLLEVRPGNCVLINISDHPGNYDVTENVARLQAVFPVVFNRVDHPQAGRHFGNIRSIIPYQSWREETELDGVRRLCNSGTYHWVADPSGDVFRCNPHMATAQKPIGNLFKHDIVIPEPIICETGCSSCYTSVPDAWPVEMRRI
jgi:hypothetical protein